MKLNKNILYTGLSLGLIISLNSQVLANAAPKKAANCCDELGARLKKLEDRAVMSTSNKVTLSGHANRAALWMDNGHHKQITHVDNNHSSTRFNLTGRGSLTDDISVMAAFEVGLGGNGSGSAVRPRVSQTNAAAQTNLYIRVAEAGFVSKAMGELYMGRGYMAQAGTVYEADMSGTTVASLSAESAQLSGGGILFTNKATKAESAFQVGAVFNVLDVNRNDRVRYNTPTFAGFKVSASHAHQDRGHIHDVALRYDNSFGKTKVKALLSYANNRSTANAHYKTTQLGAGAVFPVSMTNKEGTGLTANLGLGRAKANNTNAKGKFYYGKLGMIEQFVAVGNTAFAVDYGRYDNMTRATANKPKGTSWGLTVDQNLNAVGSEIYASYRNYKLKVKNSATRYNNSNTVMVGARVKL